MCSSGRRSVVASIYRALEWHFSPMEFQETVPDITVFTDTSGSWGCGVCWGSHWLQLQWCSRLQDLSITVKELIPVVLAAVIFGPQWSGKVV